ncbi:hypothetical protein [Streptacidiphilus rugosus]|uniref:hypothetical protein n=1 Tax=Streptacidiphilus rugosus TaxID=405783 RepID=UPI00056CB67F|nr:hypothetical protein [Streptacidiphilus rugosus]
MTQSLRPPLRARRTGSRLMAVLALAGGLTLAALPPSTASADQPGPWQPFHAGPFTDAAGDVCAFALHSEPLVDHEQIRTLAVDGSGTPTEQEITGELVVRYTDEADGRFADENLTGTAWLFHHPDGSQTWVVSGHLGLGIHAGNPYAPQGYSILTGRIVLQITADHHPYLLAHEGPTEDLCATLGG